MKSESESFISREVGLHDSLMDEQRKYIVTHGDPRFESETMNDRRDSYSLLFYLLVHMKLSRHDDDVIRTRRQ